MNAGMDFLSANVSQAGARTQEHSQSMLDLMVLNSELSPQLADKAMAVFQAIAKLPIIDPHTHYATGQIVNNAGWSTPTATVMRLQGVPEELVCGRLSRDADLPDAEFDKQRFVKMVEALHASRPNPSYVWFRIALEEVFGVKTPPTPANAEALWDGLSAKLATTEFRPQDLLRAQGVEVALTTDAPEDTLADHARHREAGLSPLLLPTWRPDAALMIEGSTRVNFGQWLDKVGQAAGVQIDSLDALTGALRSRMDHFASMGCVAADIGLSNFPVAACSHDQAARIFAKRQGGEALEPNEVEGWKSFMLTWLCLANAERNWVQYFHQGAARDLNSRIFRAQGPDAGGDAPGEVLNRAGLALLLDRLNSETVRSSADGTGLAKTVVFPINTLDYAPVLDTLNRFVGNGAGISGKLQLGPPWWFGDTADGNRDYIRLLADRGSIGSSIGMLSDARCLPSVIARFRQYRALLAVELVRKMPYQSTEELIAMATDICCNNVRRFLGLDQAVR
jgi:glucuronate isomerase